MGKWLYCNIANFVTMLGFFFCGMMLEAVMNSRPSWMLLLWICLSTATDWYDGRLARRLKIVSRFGSLADRFRDKIFFAILCVSWMLSEKFDPVAKLTLGTTAALEACLLLDLVAGLATGIDVSSGIWGKAKFFLFSTVAIIFALAETTQDEICFEFPRILQMLAVATFDFSLICVMVLTFGSLYFHTRNFRAKFYARSPV